MVTTAVFFEKAGQAKKAAAAIKKGKKLEDLIAKAVKAGTAKGSDQSGKPVKFKEVEPEIAKTLATMKIGAVSPPVKVKLKDKPYVVIFRYDEDRYPDDAAAREKARTEVLTAKRIAAIGELVASLNRQYATLNRKVFESIDFGSKGPGVDTLLEDQRVLVELKDAEPVTVAQLADAMLDKFFHGTSKLPDEKQKKAKQEVLEALVQKRLLYGEALRRGMDKTEAYRNMLKDYELNIMFGEFVQQVVTPAMKMNDDDLRAYYKEHTGEYQSETRLRIQNLVFDKKDDAVAAHEKMKKGADMGWMRANAPGQVENRETAEPAFEDQAVPLSSLPEDVQEALAGAKAEDVRLYASKQGQYHVLYVKELIPPQQQTFEQVRSTLGPKAYYAKLNQTIEDWIRKLKQAADIKVYLSDSEKP